MYSSTHSLTSALDGREWSASRPGRFTPREKHPWYPLDRRLGGPQSRYIHNFTKGGHVLLYVVHIQVNHIDKVT